MNGLDLEATLRTLERGQDALTQAFGQPVRGFLAACWQPGQVRRGTGNGLGLEHCLGFFSRKSLRGRRDPLSTFTWDGGRWGGLGHLGHGIGWLLQSLGRGVPALAIHPRDLARGFWPKILLLIQTLLEAGYAPSTAAGLLWASDADHVV